MKIGIIGVGVVGGAVRHGLRHIGHDVSVYDIKIPGSSIEDVLETAACFLCVPTKTTADGHNDTSVVNATIATLAAKGYRGVVAIKSTVVPGTTDALAEKYPELRLAFCPEFLRERYAEVDFLENMDVCPIGAYEDNDFDVLKDAHAHLPQHVVRLTPKEAEFVKYFSNVFNALRIVFANQFYEVCDAAGVDYTRIKNTVVHRKNIPNAYLECNDVMRGFGGMCLPKDTLAFATFARKLGLDVRLFDLIVEENAKYPVTVFDGMRADGGVEKAS